MSARLSLAALVAVLACGDTKSGSSPRAPKTQSDATPPRADTPPKIQLADQPTIDLLGNRYRFHTGSSSSLFVPLAAEGLRKYTQDYAQPWGDVIEVDNVRGRRLSRRSTSLRVPWRGPAPAALQLRVHGLVGGQKLSIRINGKSSVSRAAASEWSMVSVPAAAIVDGENVIELSVARHGKANGKSSWALWHSLVLGGDDAQLPASLEPAQNEALTGHARFSIYQEIPASAHLVFESRTTKTATLSVRATGVDGKTTSLLSAEQAPGSKERRLSLAELANQLVILDFETTAPAETEWAAPRIALEKVDVAKRPPPIDNAVLVVIDALRADKLKAYAGDTRVKTPRMTAEIDARGAVFLHNQAASPSSPPSHGSIQTGMIPRVHGVVGDKAQLKPGTPMLSTQARDAGLAAGYYGNNSFGMGRLEKPGNWTEFHQPVFEGKGNDCSALVPEMLGFAKDQSDAGTRFALSSLPIETHTNYRYHKGISDQYHAGPWGPPVGKSVGGALLSSIVSGRTKLSKKQWAQLFALYDGEVTYVDGCFGALLDGLKDLGIADKTALILTSDHGEGMFEHGRLGHAWGHHGELGNVPLVLFVPGLTDGGKRIDVPSSHIDIVPTMLDLLGVDIDPKVQGRSLVPLMLRDGPWTPRVVSLEYGRSYSLRARGWRYIVDYSGNESLFDLAADPSEQNDVVSSAPIALRYLRDIAGFFLAHRSEWSVRKWGDLANHNPAFARDMMH